MIRMSLYPDYYPKMYHYTTKIHIGKLNIVDCLIISAKVDLIVYSEHCLDVLRLSVMCQGDMTLIPTKDSDSRPFEAVFETVHACRDFSAIREWSIERDSATPSKFNANAEKLKKKMGIS